MSAVTHHLPKVAYFDWSEFSDFDATQKAQAVKMLREAKPHVETLTLRQAIAQAAQDAQITNASVWAAFYLLWQQIRDGNPHSERQLMQVLEQYEADEGFQARAARELITNAIDCYHTDRIDYVCGLVQAWGPKVKAVVQDDELHARLGQQVAEGTKTLADAALEAEHIEAGTD